MLQTTNIYVFNLNFMKKTKNKQVTMKRKDSNIHFLSYK